MTAIRQSPKQNKLATDPDNIQICPRCGDVMHPPFTSISRVYKRTRICPDCGQTEAVLQFEGKDATWQPVIYEWNLQIEQYRRELNNAEELQEEAELETERLLEERDQVRRTNNQLREENKKFSVRDVKKTEVIRQLTDKIKFMDSQIKDLLTNMLHTTEDT